MMLMALLDGYVIKDMFDNNLYNDEWDNNVKVHCCSHGKQFSLSWFKQKTEEFIDEYQDNIIVYMIDYAIQPNNEMLKFYNWCSEKQIQFEWIDHHITAIENLRHYNIPGFQSSVNSGCLNTWSYLKNNEEFPIIVKMVSDFDIWNKNSKYSWKEKLFPLIYYINSLGTNLNDNKGKLVSFLKNCFSNENYINDAINIGCEITNYLEALFNQNLKKIYERDWNGYKCLILNTTFPGSTQFENHPDYKNVDLLITWSYDGKYYYYGAYTTKSTIDVGEICQTFFNGGGHKGCGGGQTKDFLFL
jgi:oligoribonuclease NrnB/cAMP/cGMP phosphodiesterase (DHH superfamily)